MNPVQQWMDSFSTWLRRLLGLQKPFATIPMDDFVRERIGLEQEQRRLLSRIKELDRRKEELFRLGMNETTERKQRIHARKIKETEEKIKRLDANLQIVSRQLRTLNGFILLKENESLLAASMLGHLGRDEVEQFMEESLVDGELQMESLQRLLAATEAAGEALDAREEDHDVAEIMREMQEARLAELEPPEAGTERTSPQVESTPLLEEPEL